MTENPLALLAGQPVIVVFAVFAAAALEYVFPPFWGDTFMLAGCVLAGADHVSVPAVFAAAVTGSTVGAAAAYWLGHRFGRASFALAGRRAQRLLDKAEATCQAHGLRVVAFNRFLPGLRAFLVPLAGLGNLPFSRVLLWSAVSNLLWCSLLLGVGLAIGPKVRDFGSLQGSFRVMALWGGGLAVLVISALTVLHFVRRPSAAR